MTYFDAQWINFPCPRCGHEIRFQRQHRGKRGKCPKCGEWVRMPGSAGRKKRGRRLKLRGRR